EMNPILNVCLGSNGEIEVDQPRDESPDVLAANEPRDDEVALAAQSPGRLLLPSRPVEQVVDHSRVKAIPRRLAPPRWGGLAHRRPRMWDQEGDDYPQEPWTSAGSRPS